MNGDLVPLLQTADASIGTTINSEEIQRVAYIWRRPIWNWCVLRLASPAMARGSGNGLGGFSSECVRLPGGSNSGIFQTENQVQIAAAGQRQADNNFMVDGVSVNSLTHGGSCSSFAPMRKRWESMTRGLHVLRCIRWPQFRSANLKRIVTHSGTISFHGFDVRPV